MNSFQHVQCRRNNFEIISGKFPRAEIKLFQSDVDEGRNNFYFSCNHGINPFTAHPVKALHFVTLV